MLCLCLQSGIQDRLFEGLTRIRFYTRWKYSTSLALRHEGGLSPSRLNINARRPEQLHSALSREDRWEDLSARHLSCIRRFPLDLAVKPQCRRKFYLSTPIPADCAAHDYEARPLRCSRLSTVTRWVPKDTNRTHQKRAPRRVLLGTVLIRSMNAASPSTRQYLDM